jgi:hypothetical protein
VDNPQSGGSETFVTRPWTQESDPLSTAATVIRLINHMVNHDSTKGEIDADQSRMSVWEELSGEGRV